MRFLHISIILCVVLAVVLNTGNAEADKGKIPKKGRGATKTPKDKGGRSAKTTPTKSGRTSNPAKPKGRGATEQESPPIDPGEASPPIDPVEASPPIDPVEAYPQIDPGEASPPIDPGEASPPIDPGQASPPIDPGEASPPIDEASPPIVPGEASPPIDPGEASPPIDPGQASPPIDPGQASPPIDPGEASPPIDPGEASPPINPGDPSLPAEDSPPIDPGKASQRIISLNEDDTKASSQIMRWATDHPDEPHTATNPEGIPMASLTASQAIGNKGHVLLQDVFLLEKLANFVRERIPERVVHAKGVGAYGEFEVLMDVTQYTKAKFLDTIGKKTNVACRISTIGGELGSADTLPGARGFAVKFYTEEGIYDFVGNSLETFPIRDPMMFPDLIHSRKRNPATHLRDPTMFWDFVSLRPESTLHTLQLFSDLGSPDGVRRLNGSGVHTFKWVNAESAAVYIKYHWVCNQEKKILTRDEMITLAGSNPDYSTQDLYEAIERAEYPSWDLYVQTMTIEQAESHPQNPFDVTKVWSREEYPLIGPVGKMTLNINPTDYFTQVEQAAFSPANLVPGIEPSPDRMLHLRMASYPDAQRYRIGPNFAQLPVNKPTSRVEGYTRDGPMCFGTNGNGAPNYFPNSYGGLTKDASAAQSVFPVSGDVDRLDTGDDDNFSLAKTFVENEIDDEERERMVNKLALGLSRAHEDVQKRVIANNFVPISPEFSASVEAAIAALQSSRDLRTYENLPE